MKRGVPNRQGMLGVWLTYAEHDRLLVVARQALAIFEDRKFELADSLQAQEMAFNARAVLAEAAADQ